MRALALLTLMVLSACAEGDAEKGAVDTGAAEDAGVVPEDADGDGVPASDDCDDFDARVFPGAEEVCNEVDDDCDGDIDEGALLTFYVDADGDGFGHADLPVEACEPRRGRLWRPGTVTTRTPPCTPRPPRSATRWTTTATGTSTRT